ncbi:hypothetical protein DPEC_G00216080 [Dallia pectoralis]|uniref:Uncharacterized protein n=1 Tax=Dallia pectoralis TaxID=75939 RepID=A0ACC2G2W6_DALPE|nr:hypothetical protein DPEC_G00216080 [Dallia pectoralis]
MMTRSRVARLLRPFSRSCGSPSLPVWSPTAGARRREEAHGSHASTPTTQTQPTPSSSGFGFRPPPSTEGPAGGTLRAAPASASNGLLGFPGSWEPSVST